MTMTAMGVIYTGEGNVCAGMERHGEERKTVEGVPYRLDAAVGRVVPCGWIRRGLDGGRRDVVY